MSEHDTIFDRIKLYEAEFSSKQQKLATYIKNNYQEAAFLNSTNLAKAADVSGSTVIRFAEALHYDGFPKMKEALHKVVQKEINNVDAFINGDAAAPFQPGQATTGNDNHTSTLFQPCIDSFTAIERALPPNVLSDAARLLAGAANLYVVGFQGSAFLAEYMSYYLAKIRRNVYKVNSLNSSMFQTIYSTEPQRNAALVYAFPRFPVNTRKFVTYFKERNVPIVCMSTVYDNEISKMADIIIPIDIEYRAYFDHMAPIVYLSEYLGKKIAQLNHDESVHQLEAFEEYARTAHLFCSKTEL